MFSAQKTVRGETIVARFGRRGVTVRPTRIEGESQYRTGGAGIQIAGENLRKLRRVNSGFSQNYFHLFLSSSLWAVIEMGVENAKLLPGFAIAQSHPINVAGPQRFPRKRARKMWRFGKPESSG